MARYPAGRAIPTTDGFYRPDRSRSLTRNRLGLSIMTAIASPHSGKLDLSDASPGPVARIVPRRADAAEL